MVTKSRKRLYSIAPKFNLKFNWFGQSKYQMIWRSAELSISARLLKLPKHQNTDLPSPRNTPNSDSYCFDKGRQKVDKKARYSISYYFAWFRWFPRSEISKYLDTFCFSVLHTLLRVQVARDLQRGGCAQWRPWDTVQYSNCVFSGERHPYLK